MTGIWLGANAGDRAEALVLCCTSAYLAPADLWNSRIRTSGGTRYDINCQDVVLSRWFRRHPFRKRSFRRGFCSRSVGIHFSGRLRWLLCSYTGHGLPPGPSEDREALSGDCWHRRFAAPLEHGKLIGGRYLWKRISGECGSDWKHHKKMPLTTSAEIFKQKH